MKRFLRGNYKVEAVIEAPRDTPADGTDEFERSALARLGGSICFVSKKSFIWTGEEPDGARKADRSEA
jgi:hypothetical protein